MRTKAALHSQPSAKGMVAALQDLGQEEEEREVEEVEMLLGAYYMNLDSVWNKLTDIAEFVDDAEVGWHLD